MHSCIHTLQIALLIPGIVAHGFSKGFPALCKPQTRAILCLRDTCKVSLALWSTWTPPDHTNG